MTSLLARAIQVAAEQRARAEAMRDLALRDELTQLHNRRGLLAFARRECNRAAPAGRRSVLVFADVDGLKAINDKYGHLEGDEVLRETARILKATFRDADVIARLGGDEFVVLATAAAPHTEEILAARLQENFRGADFARLRCRFSVTVGVASIDSNHTAALSHLLGRADKAMYRRKRRPRVCDAEIMDVASPAGLPHQEAPLPLPA